MTEQQVVSTEKMEKEKQKSTNWYLVGGVAFATGLALFAVGTVVVTRRKKMQLYEFEGREDSVEWTEESYLNDFLTASQNTFTRMWKTAMGGLKKIDGVIRTRFSTNQNVGPMVSKAEIDAKANSMETTDDDLFVGEF